MTRSDSLAARMDSAQAGQKLPATDAMMVDFPLWMKGLSRVS